MPWSQGGTLAPEKKARTKILPLGHARVCGSDIEAGFDGFRVRVAFRRALNKIERKKKKDDTYMQVA